MTAVSPATLQICRTNITRCRGIHICARRGDPKESKAIVDAGFVLQIDDPALVDIYDWWFSMKADLARYRKWAAFQVDVLIAACGYSGRSRPFPHLLGSLARPHQGDVCN